MLKILDKIPTIAYAAGFVGCAVISYILYPQSKSKKSIKKGIYIYISILILISLTLTNKTKKGCPRGLINCKNECFINVILQSLAASDKVTNWLLKNKSSSSTNLFDTLAMIIVRINRLESELLPIINNNNETKTNDLSITDQDQDEFYAAQSFKTALSAHNWIIQSEEHDCHELFHLIMDVLDEEHLETKKSLTSLNYFQAASHLKENSRLKSKNPFHGYLLSQLQCLDCNYKVNFFIKFLILRIVIAFSKSIH
jgi:ubiquitin C-terminal hydrolase